jgi:uncharacterized protein YecA (UPF0149 family)
LQIEELGPVFDTMEQAQIDQCARSQRCALSHSYAANRKSLETIGSGRKYKQCCMARLQ